MKNTRIHAGLLSLIAAGMLAASQAQAFGLDSLKAAAGAALNTAAQGGEAAGAENLAQQQDLLMQRFNASMNNMLMAQAKTLEATGQTDIASRTLAAAANYAQGANTDTASIAADTELTSSNQALIQSLLAQGGTLSGANRSTLAEAIPFYQNGLKEGSLLSGAFQSWLASAKGSAGSLLSNPMAAGELTRSIGEASSVARNLPSLINAWSGPSQSFLSLANANQVDAGQLQSILAALN